MAQFSPIFDPAGRARGKDQMLMMLIIAARGENRNVFKNRGRVEARA
jgi:hypothetical protein